MSSERPKRAGVTLARAMAVILLCLSAATTAHAQDYPPDIVGIEVSEDVVKPGDKVEVRVPGFCPQSSVAVYLVPAGKARIARRGGDSGSSGSPPAAPTAAVP